MQQIKVVRNTLNLLPHKKEQIVDTERQVRLRGVLILSTRRRLLPHRKAAVQAEEGASVEEMK